MCKEVLVGDRILVHEEVALKEGPNHPKIDDRMKPIVIHGRPNSHTQSVWVKGIHELTQSFKRQQLQIPLEELREGTADVGSREVIQKPFTEHNKIPDGGIRYAHAVG
jgi:hypothetical protein